MLNKIKKIVVCMALLFVPLALGGCGDNIEEMELDEIEIEGAENMSDDELNKALIERAEQEEVVPDKK